MGISLGKLISFKNTFHNAKVFIFLLLKRLRFS